ncbi:MAG: type II secretion system protein GspK [Gemmatimonadales bacterium]
MALALALWLVVVLSVVAAGVVASTRSASTIVLNLRARTVARYAAESGIEAGVMLLERRLATAYTPTQQALAIGDVPREVEGLREVALGGAEFGVAVSNPNARLDLNQADPAALMGLFSRFAPAAVARGAVDALQDYRDADDLVRPAGAEADAYRRAGSRYAPRNAPLTRVDEFRRVLGVTDSLARAVEPYVTVDGDLRIDVNAASEEVLAAIPGIGPDGARTLVARRSGGRTFLAVSEVQALLGRGRGSATALPIPRLAVAPSRLLLVSRGWQRGHPLTHEIEAAYALVGRRLVLQSWRERDL